MDTRGSADRADVGVGAHVKHVNAGLRPATSCAVCHSSTPLDGNTAHADAAVTIGWNLARQREGRLPELEQRELPELLPLLRQAHRRHRVAPARPSRGRALRPRSAARTATRRSPQTNAHAKHVTTYGVGCKACHVATAATSTTIVSGGGAHVSGGNDVGFDGTDTYVAPGTWDGALYTCASTYCHSNGQDRDPAGGFGSAASRAWNAGSGGCTACHEAGTALLSGSHPAHVNQAGTYATTYGCQTCHASTTTDGSSIASTTLHVNMAADVTPAATLNWASGGCTTYCHSSGQGGAASPQHYSDMAWGTPLANDCKQCHGRYSPADPAFTTTYGAPNYVSGGTAAATANSHKKHVSSGADCYVCHKGTANATGDAIVTSSTAHLDGNRQVSFDSTKAGSSATYSNDANKRCSNVSCHGVGQPQWGGPPQACDSCHFATNDSDDFTSITNDSASAISSGEWADRGHGQTTTAFDEFNLASGVTNRCVYCHDDQNASANHKQSGNPFRLRGASDAAGATALYANGTSLATIAICLDCHAVSGANGVDPDGAGPQPKVGPATLRVDAYHGGGKHGDDNGGKRCWDCHDPHGDGSNIKMVGKEVLVWGDADGFVGTRAAQAVTFTLSDIGGYAKTVAPYDGVCQVCHEATGHLGTATSMQYWLSNGTGPHNADQDCMTCHTHQQPPGNAFQGAGACSSCHLAPANVGVGDDRDELPPVYGGGANKSFVDREEWASTGHGNAGNYDQSGYAGAGFPVTSTVEGCYYCHAPDTALFGGGQTSKHANVTDGTNPFRLANTNWNGKGKNGVCLVCHAASGATGFDPDGAAGVDFPSTGKLASHRISEAHAGAKHGALADGGTLCWDCHDPHGDANYDVVPTGRSIAFMIQARPTKDAADAWGASGTFAAANVDFNKATGGDTAALDGADYVGAGNPAPGVCQVCHSSTTFWKADGSAGGHQNGATRCGACHAHEQATNLAFKQIDATNNCGACHPAIPGARHASHLSATPSQTYGDTAVHSTTTDYDFGCGKCHATPTAVHYDDGGGTAGDPYRADVAFDVDNGTAATYPAIAQPPAATQTGPTPPGLVFGWQDGACSNTYCHDPQGGAYTGIDKKAVSWNTTQTLGCGACHDTANGKGTTALPYAHATHTTNAAGSYDYGCEKCHASTAASSSSLASGAGLGKAQHVDGDRYDVAFNASPVAQPGSSYSGGTAGTCSATYCHSDGKKQVSPFNAPLTALAWNQASSCTSCHAGGGGTGTTLTGAHGKHVNATTSGGYALPCQTCHTATWNGTQIVWSAGVTQHVDADVDGDVKFGATPIAQPVAAYVPAHREVQQHLLPLQRQVDDVAVRRHGLHRLDLRRRLRQVPRGAARDDGSPLDDEPRLHLGHLLQPLPREHRR